MIDRSSIVEGEDWRKRLGALIAGADTVAFVLSPDSAKSPICAWEVEEAVRLSKRIIPVLCRPLGAQPAPEKLAALNYVRFDEGRSFMGGLKGLARALNTDLAWLREHTRLLARAMEWESAGRLENRMLSGADIGAAKTWAARRPRGAPEPTALHLDFIRASEDAESARENAERQQLADIAAAQEARAKALTDAEDALRRAAEAQRARARARSIIVWGSASAALVLAAIAAFAGLQWREANAQKEEAERQTAIARESKLSLARNVEELKGANLRLSQKMGLRIAPYGNEPQTIKDTWYRIATEYAGAIAVVTRGKSEASPVGNGFIIKGAALYDGWRNETVFVTSSLIVSSNPSSHQAPIEETVAYFPGLGSSPEFIEFSEILWESGPTPKGVYLSVLKIKSPLPFGARPIEAVWSSPLDFLEALDRKNSEAVLAVIAKGNARTLATLGLLVQSGFSLIINHLLGTADATASAEPLELVYTYATGPAATGSPVFDIETGALICVHLAGIGASSKFKAGVGTGSGVSIRRLIAAIKADPASVEKGLAELEGKNIGRAMETFDRSIELARAPGGSRDILKRALEGRSRAYEASGKPEQAKADFEEAQTLGAEVPNAP